MSAFYRVSSFAGAMVVTVALLVGGYYVVNQLWTLYLELEFVTRTILLTIAAVSLIAASMISGAVRGISRAREAAPLVERKYRMYVSMVDYSRAAMESHFDRDSGSTSSPEIANTNWQEDALLLADKTVLAHLSGLEDALADCDTTPQQIQNLYRDLVNSIRRDLGHRTSNNVAISEYVKKQIESRPCMRKGIRLSQPANRPASC